MSVSAHRRAGVRYGVALSLDRPMSELLAVGAEAEALGFDTVWATEDRLRRDVFCFLAALALHTSRVRLGPGVTNPYSRHPALLAAAMATLDDLSGGRTVLGLGAGGTNHRALGIRRDAPAVALREAIEVIRALWAGAEVTLRGRVVQAVEARLEFPPTRPIPIYLGARGPRVLELAGELADGVIVGNVATPRGWRYALEHVLAGTRRSGRDASRLSLAAWLYCAISDRLEAAVEAIRPLVATSLVTSRPVLAHLGVDLPSRFVAAMEGTAWSLEQASVERAGRELPLELLPTFGLLGDPGQCREHLLELLEALPWISEVVIVPVPVAGQPLGQVVRRFIAEVAPTPALGPAR